MPILVMPQISYFLGVIIRMFYRDHNPPHFHAFYGEFEAIIDIQKNIFIKMLGREPEIFTKKDNTDEK